MLQNWTVVKYSHSLHTTLYISHISINCFFNITNWQICSINKMDDHNVGENDMLKGVHLSNRKNNS